LAGHRENAPLERGTLLPAEHLSDYADALGVPSSSFLRPRRIDNTRDDPTKPKRNCKHVRRVSATSSLADRQRQSASALLLVLLKPPLPLLRHEPESSDAWSSHRSWGSSSFRSALLLSHPLGCHWSELLLSLDALVPLEVTLLWLNPLTSWTTPTPSVPHEGKLHASAGHTNHVDSALLVVGFLQSTLLSRGHKCRSVTGVNYHHESAGAHSDQTVWVCHGSPDQVGNRGLNLEVLPKGSPNSDHQIQLVASTIRKTPWACAFCVVRTVRLIQRSKMLRCSARAYAGARWSPSPGPPALGLPLLPKQILEDLGGGASTHGEPFTGLTVRNHPASRSYSRLHASIFRCYPTHAHAACPYGLLHSNTCVGCEGMGLSASLTFQFRSTDGSGWHPPRPTTSVSG